MGGLLAVIGFSLGAGVGMKAARAVGSALAPALNEAIGIGKLTGGAARAIASTAASAVGDAVASARDGVTSLRDEVRSENAAKKRTTKAQEVRSIAIAKE